MVSKSWKELVRKELRHQFLSWLKRVWMTGHGFELERMTIQTFYLEELKMRIQALLKRSGKFNENTLTYGEECQSFNEWSGGGRHACGTARKEFELLVYFSKSNVILPKTQIFDRLWGFDMKDYFRCRVYVSKVRKKLKGTAFAENLKPCVVSVYFKKMFNKLKKTWYADDFSYFIRNFECSLWFSSAMTLIILQVMHSSSTPL